MGLILILIAGAALVVLGGPCLVLAILVCTKGTRSAAFWLPCLLTLLVSVVAQYAVVLAPFVRQGEYSWDLFLGPLWGWHLAPPLVIAAVLWLLERKRRRPVPLGIVAGLLFSIPALLALAFPLGFIVPAAFGL